MQPQKLCLKWNNHTVNLLSVLGSFQQKDILVDVTISCEGQNIKAHKMVLSACSPYFQSIFLENPCQHPIVIINGIKYEDITAILNFMYKGEVNVSQDGLSSFLQAAEALKVKGLAEVCGERKSTNSINQEAQHNEQSRPQRTDTPPRKKHRNRKRSLSDSNKSDDEGTARKHHREPSSPEVHELSGDESFTGDNTSNGPPFHSSPRVPQNIYSRSHQSSSNLGGEDDDDYEVEPSKLLEQTLTTDNVSMNNSSSDNNLRIERIMGNATEIESSNIQEPESPPDIKPIIDYGESSAGPSEGNLMLYSEHSQPGPSSVQDGSLLHDNSHAQGIKIIPKKAEILRPVKLNNILFPVNLPSLPQLFLINSNAWNQQQQQQQQQQQPQPQPAPRDIDIVEDPVVNTVRIKKEPKEVVKYTTVTSRSSTYESISNDTPLPEFSDVIQHHINQNDLSAVWGLFIDECARYYHSKFPNIQNSSEYQTIGKKMYANYPIIASDGKEPWSFFCKSLSQKIRHIKWKIKRKKMGLNVRNPRERKTGNFKLRSVRRKVDHRYTPSKLYKALSKELVEGWKNKSISEYRVLDILKQTNKGRKTWLESHPKRKISSLIAEYPCFLKAKFVVEDFLFTINQEDITLLLSKFDALFTAVGTIMKPPVENQSFLQQIQILKFLEEEIAFEKGRRSTSKSIFVHKIDVPEDERMSHIEKVDDSFPVLYIFSDGENIEKMYVGGDKTIIDISATDLYEGLIVLIATYYTCGLEYPKSMSQILGLFQIYCVGDSYDGIKSIKFKMFLKTLNNFVDVGDAL